MSLILIISIAIRLVAMVLSVVLWRRVRDWRMGFLTLMLALMAVRQSLTLFSERDHWAVDTIGQAAELPGLVVSGLAMLAVLFLSRFLSDRKRAEEALLKSEALHRAVTHDVLDTSNVGVFILDSDFRVAWMSKVLERYFGIQRGPTIGEDKRALIKNSIKWIFDDPEAFEEKVLASYDDNTRVEQFECHVLPDGKREDRWLEHWSQPIRSGIYIGGRIEHYYDITAQKRAEKTAVESSAKLSALADEQRFLLENIHDFVYRHDTEGVFYYLSPAVEQVTGYTVDEWMKHFTAYMTDHPDNAKVIENTERAIRTGKAIPPYLVEIFHKNGSRITLEVGERPYFDDGKVAGIIGVARDITERKKAEGERNRLADQLRQSQKMEALGQLAGGIAHDFNNLLTAILGNTEILMASLQAGGQRASTEAIKTGLERVRHAGERGRNADRTTARLQPQAGLTTAAARCRSHCHGHAIPLAPADWRAFRPHRACRSARCARCDR